MKENSKLIQENQHLIEENDFNKQVANMLENSLKQN